MLAEEEINLVLLRLIECLGHANPLVSNLAYEEVVDPYVTPKYPLTFPLAAAAVLAQ